MRVLIAEDRAEPRALLRNTLERWGYDVVAVEDGRSAWDALQADDAPRIALLDWMMPHDDGVSLCRRLRSEPRHRDLYVILLTAKSEMEDLAEGLGAGADDYLVKPYDPTELRARLQVGVRIVELHDQLATRIRELEAAHERERRLEGLLPICAYCKNVRDDENYWQDVETYLAERTEVEFTHSVCPACYAGVVIHARAERDKARSAANGG